MRAMSVIASYLLASALTANAVYARSKAPLSPHITPSSWKSDVQTREGPVADRNGTEIPPLNTTYYFDQLIDHTNPALGTFSQRYWTTWEYYEAGGPIVLTTPGEQAGDGLDWVLTNETIVGLIAQQQNGATVMLEHRFYGYSNPYDNLSVEAFQVHTLQQAIDDFVYFAENVDLPMPGGDAVTPAQAPWIFVGGSYAGALTSYIKVSQPDAFWIGYASSAPVEAIVDYWSYFDIIRQYMPQNCSSDLQTVVSYVDNTYANGTAAEIADLQSTFGMNVTHSDDFGYALAGPLFSWQDLQPDSGPGAEFFEFCDALEVKPDGLVASIEGWGLDYALDAWGSWWQDVYIPAVCGDTPTEECFTTYNQNSTYWTDISINNAARSWGWTLCNYFGWFESGAPISESTIVSRMVQPVYYERQCSYWFPEVFSTPTDPDVNATNTDYDGWFVQADRLFFANGQKDPWRDATLSANGTNFTSTSLQPIALSDGYHTSDLYTANGDVDSTVADVQEQALTAIMQWLEIWEPST